MLIGDIYFLKASHPFVIENRENITVSLNLEKAPPCYHTILTGKVVYKKQPVKNAAVIAFDDHFNPLFHTITNKKGSYTFHNILAPGTYKIAAAKTGFRTSKAKTVQVKDYSVTNLSFILKKSMLFVNGIVYGRIIEAGTRNPVNNATLYLKSSGAGHKRIYKTLSNPNGNYLIYNLLPGSYVLIAKKHGYLHFDPADLIIEKHDQIMMNLALIRNPDYTKGTISGTVTCDKKPVYDVPVFLYRLDKHRNETIIQVQSTDKMGLFLFSNLERGTYLIKGKLQSGQNFEKLHTIE